MRLLFTLDYLNCFSQKQIGDSCVCTNLSLLSDVILQSFLAWWINKLTLWHSLPFLSFPCSLSFGNNSLFFFFLKGGEFLSWWDRQVLTCPLSCMPNLGAMLFCHLASTLCWLLLLHSPFPAPRSSHGVLAAHVGQCWLCCHTDGWAWPQGQADPVCVSELCQE